MYEVDDQIYLVIDMRYKLIHGYKLKMNVLDGPATRMLIVCEGPNNAHCLSYKYIHTSFWYGGRNKLELPSFIDVTTEIRIDNPARKV